MSLSVSQMISVSYPEVLAEMRKPANQWAESAFMRELERQGAIEKINGSPVIEAPLDYRANPGAAFNSTDLETVDTTKTDVLTAAQYASAQLQIPITWSKKDEAENPTTNQKIALVKSLIENAVNSHDDTIEAALFQSNTNGFVGLPGLLNASDGTDSIGGIDASADVFWKNVFSSTGWVNSAGIVAALTTAYNKAAKGSGSTLAPKFLVSDAATQAIYEGTQQGFIRYVDTKEADAGFKVCAFKTARYVFSQYGTDTIYMLNPKSFKLMVVKQAFRLLGDTIEFPDAAGYVRKMFTLCQTKTDNRSRLAAVKKS